MWNTTIYNQDWNTMPDTNNVEQQFKRHHRRCNGVYKKYLEFLNQLPEDIRNQYESMVYNRIPKLIAGIDAIEFDLYTVIEDISDIPTYVYASVYLRYFLVRSDTIRFLFKDGWVKTDEVEETLLDMRRCLDILWGDLNRRIQRLLYDDYARPRRGMTTNRLSAEYWKQWSNYDDYVVFYKKGWEFQQALREDDLVLPRADTIYLKDTPEDIDHLKDMIISIYTMHSEQFPVETQKAVNYLIARLIMTAVSH